MKYLRILIFGLVLVISNVFSGDLVSIDTREGVTQKFELIKPEKPVASVILFSGGKGLLKLSSMFGNTSYKGGKTNFLVKSRDIFVENGFIVAVVDAPSDKQKKRGLFGGFRNSMMHQEDIDAVIKYLKKEADLPIWLIGTSRGTESATNVAINTEVGINGLVLTSSMSVANRSGTAVIEMDLNDIEVPTLIVGHNSDGCANTPPDGAKEIAKLLTSSSKVEVVMFDGGYEKGNPCKGKSYHSFLGIEEEVIRKISDFIKSN